MLINLPKHNHLEETSEIDYYIWNYKFPIKYIQKYRFKVILELLGSIYYDNILEIGTGSGIFLPELSRHCRALYAADIHGKMANIQKLASAYDFKVQLTRSSIEFAPFRNDFFDVVVAISVLEFVNDLDKTLFEIRRILKSGGILVTICPQENTFCDLVLSFWTKKSPSIEFRDTRSKVYSSLESSFKVIEKKVFPPVFGRLAPVYYSYKLMK